MTNVTFKVDEPLISKARLRARQENRSLNAVFVDWLRLYTGKGKASDYATLKKKWKHIKSGRHFTRDELNER